LTPTFFLLFYTSTPDSLNCCAYVLHFARHDIRHKMTDKLTDEEKYPADLPRLSRIIRELGRKSDKTYGFPNEIRRQCLAIDKDAWGKYGTLQQCCKYKKKVQLDETIKDSNNPNICCALGECNIVVRKYCSKKTKIELINIITTKVHEFGLPPNEKKDSERQKKTRFEKLTDEEKKKRKEQHEAKIKDAKKKAFEEKREN